MLCGREMLILDLFAHPLTDHPDQASRWIGAPLPFSTRMVTVRTHLDKMQATVQRDADDHWCPGNRRTDP